MNRPELIDVELVRALEAMQAKARPRPPMAQPVLQGMATLYNRPHEYRGRIEMLSPGCFAKSLASGERIRFLLDHDDKIEAASTWHGLELTDAEDGLLFNLDLRKAKSGGFLARMAEIGDRASMSVAYTATFDRTEIYAGYPVRVITEAKLHEISLCRLGVVKYAFAYLTDAAVTPKPTATDRSLAFRTAHNVHKLAMEWRGVRERVRDLKETLCATEEDRRPVAPMAQPFAYRPQSAEVGHLRY